MKIRDLDYRFLVYKIVDFLTGSILFSSACAGGYLVKCMSGAWARDLMIIAVGWMLCIAMRFLFGPSRLISDKTISSIFNLAFGIMIFFLIRLGSNYLSKISNVQEQLVLHIFLLVLLGYTVRMFYNPSLMVFLSERCES